MPSCGPARANSSLATRAPALARAYSLMDNSMEDEGAQTVADALGYLPALTDLWYDYWHHNLRLE